ncbi:hypothetical protein C2E21_6182 [Chlorella sorokiniana]|uniref:Uncharacterized protein n=1 Tax=Chlorella sorokiniana TaxID=3076 RepID=A0A2P6TL04_CHLSO|nr:hypothetical protein C2E21_6182 [Chlorella sorokiniana]|eukprot:PRW44977.1 hypothetical protein C2E21_6182 [Chlorella sorokiniana]
MASENQDERLARLRAEAEAEMRRRLPTEGGRAAKRRKMGGGEAERQAGGRFDYGAIQKLATGITGFLLTCQLQRENSARKEAGPLLARYLEQCRGGGAPAAAGSSEPAAADTSNDEAAEAAPEAAEQQEAASGTAAAEEGRAFKPPALAAVKVPVRGLVALKLAAHPVAAAADANGAADVSSSSQASSSFDAASANLVHEMAAALLADIAAGKQARLQHVQRIVPVQTTCRLEAAALQAAGGQLAALVAAAVAGVNCSQQGEDRSEGTAAAAAAVAGGEGASKRPLTFGIGLKQREVSGKPAAPAPAAGDNSGDGAAAPAAAAPLDRGGIITALAGGFEQALRQQHGLAAAVDLKAPDWVLICEVVPAGGELYAALCALPRALCTLKPKLHVQVVGRAGA